MIEPPEDRRAQLSPQLAMRVALLGGVALALFAIVFFRLWFLQVLSGDQYLAEASSNRVRDVTIQAPRGEMTDRNGRVLVANRPAVEVTVSPQRLPDLETHRAERRDLLARLSRVLGRSTRPQRCVFGSGRTRRVFARMPLECLIEQQASVAPYADVVVSPDASKAVYTFLAERLQEYPGVDVQSTYLRSYPLHTIGAQLFGTVGQIDGDELRQQHFRGVKGGSIVGKGGLEYSYDHYLRGTNGAQRIQVDAFGKATRKLDSVAPQRGNDLKLSIDAGLQKAGQDALVQGISLAQANGNGATGGAFVALDPRSGEVLAMGSNPTFDPNDFTRPIPQKQYDAKFGEAAGNPLFNRATQGGYATGSTFKPITAIAALAAGKTTTGEVYDDTGTWRSGAQVRRNAGGAVYGPVAMQQAIAESVDTYFYNLGARLNADPVKDPNGGALQQWARRFGFGEANGVDVGYESPGNVPDPRWREGYAHREARCRRRRHVDSCGISDMRPWSIGDNVSLAIGQGDLQASPLQLAVAYSAIENGGTIVRPHIGMQVLDDRGRLIQRIDPRPVRRFDIPDLATIQAGLLDSTTQQGGTATDVFQGFPHPVYGKTGTAQYDYRPDTSWYAAYVPDPVRPIVVTCVIENGGFGAEAAAPAVRLILSQWFGVRKEVKAGSSTTA